MKFYRKINREQDLGNGKRLENNFKEIDKGFFKGRKIECFYFKEIDLGNKTSIF